MKGKSENRTKKMLYECKFASFSPLHIRNYYASKGTKDNDDEDQFVLSIFHSSLFLFLFHDLLHSSISPSPKSKDSNTNNKVKDHQKFMMILNFK